MKVFTIGRLTYSNCEYRHNIMIYNYPHKHLFWRFWWKITL